MRVAVASVIVCASCGRIGFGLGTSDGSTAGSAVSDGASDGASLTSDAPITFQPINAAGVWSTVGANLSRTLATTTSQTFTFATWYKSSNIATMLLCAGISSAQQTYLWADDTQGTVFFKDEENATIYGAGPDVATWPYSDNWVHLVVAVDLSQAAPDQRVQWWLDGVAQTISTDAFQAFTQGQPLYLGEALLHTLGTKYDGGFGWTGLLAETYLIWGHRLDPSSFVTTVQGNLRSIAYSGPIDDESFYFDYQVLGHNGFAGQPDWSVSMVTSSAADLPY